MKTKKDLRELVGKGPTLPAQEGLDREEQELVDTLLSGIGKDGGFAKRKIWEAVIRTSFRSGVIHAAP